MNKKGLQKTNYIDYTKRRFLEGKCRETLLFSEKQGFGLNHKQSQYIHRECKLHFYCTTRPCFALWGSSGASKDANHNTNTSTKANDSKQ